MLGDARARCGDSICIYHVIKTLSFKASFARAVCGYVAAQSVQINPDVFF